MYVCVSIYTLHLYFQISHFFVVSLHISTTVIQTTIDIIFQINGYILYVNGNLWECGCQLLVKPKKFFQKLYNRL